VLVVRRVLLLTFSLSLKIITPPVFSFGFRGEDVISSRVAWKIAIFRVLVKQTIHGLGQVFRYSPLLDPEEATPIPLDRFSCRASSPGMDGPLGVSKRCSTDFFFSRAGLSSIRFPFVIPPLAPVSVTPARDVRRLLFFRGGCTAAPRRFPS